MTPALRAVLFDLDGTLLDRRSSFERFVRGQWARFETVREVVACDEYARTLIRLDGNGYAPRQEMFSGVVATFGLPAALADELRRDFKAGFAEACVLFPGVTETLNTLGAAGLKLGLITNGSVGMQSRKLECLGLAQAFDVVVISEAEGVHKPDPEIFHRALARLAAGPAEASFVGDHPDVDVAGARAAGMRAIWRRDPGFAAPAGADATIDEVGDLVSLLL